MKKSPKTPTLPTESRSAEIRTPFLKQSRDAVLVEIHVQPQASKTEIVGLHGDRLKIRVQAPPVDGAANQAICEFFSSLLGCAKQNIQISKGESSRQKTINIGGLPISQVQSKILSSFKG